MNFECPECQGNKTLAGAYFETCAGCGYCSVDSKRHIEILASVIASMEADEARLLARINSLEKELAPRVSAINRLMDENNNIGAENIKLRAMLQASEEALASEMGE